MMLTAMMEMWLRLVGPIGQDAVKTVPVKHADFCHCRKPGCHTAPAAIVFNTK